MEVSMRRYTVVCHWEGSDQWEADADEITVSAESAAKAIAKARKQWRLTFGAEWPHLRLTDSFIVTNKIIQESST
jgi:hypothetical protein